MVLVISAVLTIPQIAYSQKKKSESIYLAGQIKGYKYRDITISYYKDYLYYQNKTSTTIVTGKKGEFEVNFKWEKPWPAFMLIGNKSINLFLCPGDSLIINSSLGKIDNRAEYSGTAGVVHSTLQKYVNYYHKINIELLQQMPKLQETEFLSMNQTNYIEQKTFIDSSFGDDNKSAGYKYISALCEYTYYNNIFVYCKTINRFFKTDEINNLIPEERINNEGALPALIFIEFLENYLNWREAISTEVDEKSNFWNFKYRLSKNILKSKVRDIILARILKRAFEYTYDVTAKNLYNDYSRIYIDQEYFAALKAKFQSSH